MVVFYVNDISDQTVGGFSLPQIGLYPAVVRANWPPGKAAGYVENITAHELGHILGRGGLLNTRDAQNVVVPVRTPSHTLRGANFLMFPNNPGIVKQRLSRDDWNIMNFYEKSPIPKRQ